MKSVLAGVLFLAMALFFPPTASADTDLRNFNHGGRKRIYRLFKPLRTKLKPALLVMLHGGGGSAAGFQEYAGVDEIARREGFLVVYPQGVASGTAGKPFATWNVGVCCGKALKENVDDVGFVSDLVKSLIESHGVDPERVYLSGHSNGAMLSYRLICEKSEMFAAAVPYGSTGPVGACKPKKPVPILHIHGKLDACSPYEGGQCGNCFQEFFQNIGLPAKDVWRDCQSVEDHARDWRAAYGLGDKTWKTWNDKHARCKAWKDGETVTALCALEGQGHAWPGAQAREENAACKKRPKSKLCQEWVKIMGPYKQGYSAAEKMWDFFKDKRR